MSNFFLRHVPPRQTMAPQAWAVVLFSILWVPRILNAAAGTDTASFLSIPVGAGPAALGSAYSALATDAYAPTWNPAGMPWASHTEFSGQHVSYLQSVDYEYLSVVHRLGDSGNRAIGAAAQYLGTGEIDSTNLGGNNIGSFSSHFAAYSLAYAQRLGKKLSLGATGKVINAKIGDFSANAYAMDFGAMLPIQSNLTLAAVVANIGTQLNFISDAEPLPLEGRLALAYRPAHQWVLALEGSCDRSRQLAGHFAAEWRPLEIIAIRAGYRTDATSQLNGTVGVTAGLGLYLWGQEFSYAWVPYGDLGDAQYFSLVLRFGGVESHRRNLIHYQTIQQHRFAYSPYYDAGRSEDEEKEQILQLLEQGDTRRVAVGQP